MDEDESPARSSAVGKPGSRTSSFGSNRGPPTSSFQRPKLSSHSRDPSNALADSDSDSSDSSEDEPLTAIKQKQSSSSLASRASLAIPGVQTKPSSQNSSPAKSSRSNSNMSLPPVSSPIVGRPAISPSSLPAASPAMSPSLISSRISLASTVVPRPPTSFVTAGSRTRDSPASSQSGATTGDTSSGGLPVTPKESVVALSNPATLHSARSSFSSTQYANNARRVSFAEDEKAKAAQNAKDEVSKDQSRKTNERRREEARKATEVSWSRVCQVNSS